MTRSSIPVDLFNPGQVLASLGFLEAADVLCSRASGGFEWADEANTRFVIDAEGDKNPFAMVLEFLAKAELQRIAPPGYKDPPQKKKPKKAPDDSEEEDARSDDLVYSDNFPAQEPDRMTLPVRLTHAGQGLDITHWADGSSRNDFKLYAGNRSAARIAQAMLMGTRDKPRKGQKVGELKAKGIRTLWEEDDECLVRHPFDVLTRMGGSFNFDLRGAWTALDAGYSPNDQKHGVAASPVVELLAAIGLEHARPIEDHETRTVRYALWRELLSPSLARPALSVARFGVALRTFQFNVAFSGKNKVITFAEEEI